MEGAQIEFRDVSYRYPEGASDVLHDITLSLPSGMVSLVGQNGTGKTTLLLLAGGVLMPDAGKVFLRGVDSADLRDETERHRIASFLYQNMEFDSDGSIGELLESVHAGGFHAQRNPGLVKELVRAFSLEPVLGRGTQDVSKGELQRTILAFSLLYGSPLLMMDEPVFALEDRQKEAALEYLRDYARREKAGIYFSLHELELSRKFSDHVLLFSKAGAPRLGPTEELFTDRAIEEAYQVPMFLLKKREDIYRRLLIEVAARGGKPQRGS